MAYTLQVVRSVAGSPAYVWGTLLRTRTFLVTPHKSLGLRVRGEDELRSGASVAATLVLGPLTLPSAWVVETHDRNDGRLELRGAECLERRGLWDIQVLIGNGGGSDRHPRSNVDYRIRLPGRASALRLGAERIIERRHRSLREEVRKFEADARAQLEFHGASGAPVIINPGQLQPIDLDCVFPAR